MPSDSFFLGEKVKLVKKKQHKSLKRQHNGKIGWIVGTTKTWLTVLYVDDKKGKQRIKWPKIAAEPIPVSRCDPNPMLGDDLCCEIFSYLYTPVNSASNIPERRSVAEAAKLYFQLAPVCKRWRNLCEKHFDFGFVEWDTDIDSHEIVHAVFLSRCKPPLVGNLPSLWSPLQIPILVHILEQCDTSRITKILFNTDMVDRGGMMNQFLGEDFRDVLVRLGMEEPKGTPSAKIRRIQQLLLETLSRECPQLEELDIQYYQNRWDLEESMCLPLSLNKLTLQLNYYCDSKHAASSASREDNIVANSLSNLKKLERLELEGGPGTNRIALPIESKSLRILDASGLSDKALVYYCHCPRLEVLVGGDHHKRGTLPVLSRGQFDRLKNDPQNQGSSHLIFTAHIAERAGDMQFIGLENVPPTCIYKVDVMLPLNYEMYLTWIERDTKAYRTSFNQLVTRRAKYPAPAQPANQETVPIARQAQRHPPQLVNQGRIPQQATQWKPPPMAQQRRIAQQSQRRQLPQQAQILAQQQAQLQFQAQQMTFQAQHIRYAQFQMQAQYRARFQVGFQEHLDSLAQNQTQHYMHTARLAQQQIPQQTQHLPMAQLQIPRQAHHQTPAQLQAQGLGLPALSTDARRPFPPCAQRKT